MEEAKDTRFRQVYNELEFYERHNTWEKKGSRLVISGEPKVQSDLMSARRGSSSIEFKRS